MNEFEAVTEMIERRKNYILSNRIVMNENRAGQKVPRKIRVS